MIIGAMIIGHMIGDYILQTPAMAINKSKPGKGGDWTCTAHSLIYALCVMFCVLLVAPPVAPLYAMVVGFMIYTSHYWIDRYSLAKKFMIWKGMDYVDFAEPGHLFLYAATDNAMHLFLMFLILMVML